MEIALTSTHWARRLRMRHLESYLLLCDAGTLSAAATQLHMTQSAVSHWLSELEDLAGTRLVIRGRQLRLTPAGEAVKRFAVRVLGEVARAHDELGSIARGIVARLHLGSVTSGVAHLVPEGIARFQLSHPDISIQVTEGPLTHLLGLLEKREIDLVIGPLDARAYGPDLAQALLLNDMIAILCGRHHPLATIENVAWKDLYAYPWIMPQRGTLMRTRLENILLEHDGADFRPHVETSSVTTITALLRMTDYIGMCSADLADYLADLDAVHIIPMIDAHPFGPIGLVWRKRESDAIRDAMIEAMRAASNERRTRAQPTT
jgi:DNA-binding transcriptional LysR family regulator